MALWYDCGNGFQTTRMARKDMLVDAYLCCPGPSLAEVDASLLAQPGIMTFAINTAYPKIRPDVWIGLDRPQCYDPRVWWEPFVKLTRITAGRDIDMTISGGQHVRYMPNVYFPDLEAADPREIFQRRAHDVKFVWTKNTFTFALHFMIWLGAKRIHLLGCDFGGAKDYWDGRVLPEEQHASNRRLYGQQVEMLRELLPGFATNGIELLSCTPDSPVNAFLEYRPLGEAVRQSTRRVAHPVARVLHAAEAELCSWSADPSGDGVVVGCAPLQEWLIEWWWRHYSQTNSYPVAFADFGVAPKWREWLAERGQVIDMTDVPATGWFRKPFAVLRAPFERIVWTDLDVEIRGDLAPLFAAAAGGTVAMPPGAPGLLIGGGGEWTKTLPPPDRYHCTSIVATEHGNPLIAAWAHAVLDTSLGYGGDHEAMSHVAHHTNAQTIVLEPSLRKTPREERESLTVHYGGWGPKQWLRERIAAEEQTEPAACRWREHGVIDAAGLLVGTDEAQEWLLEFWWTRYRRHNQHPVAFADFGMSAKARAWCSERGVVIGVDGDFRDAEHANPLAATFRKPFALLRSPFRHTVMMDLDCEVRGNLDALLEHARRGCAVSHDPYAPEAATESPVQSGIVACAHGHPLPPAWAAETLRGWRSMHSDQSALNAVIDRFRDRVTILPPDLHRLRLQGDDPAALVMHWTGATGKAHIRKMMGG